MGFPPRYFASAQLSPTPTSTASGGSSVVGAAHLVAHELAHLRHLGLGHLEQQLVVHLEDEPRASPLVAQPPLRSRIIATLMMSAFEPCMTKLTAIRSPKPRVWRFEARISGTGRRRPSSDVT